MEALSGLLTWQFMVFLDICANSVYFREFYSPKTDPKCALKFESLTNNHKQRPDIGANTVGIYDVSKFELIKYALRKIASFLTVLKVHKGNFITP